MMNLPDHWYVLAEPRELHPSKPNSLRRHGLEWVVWRRSDGQWVMQQDRCPHRSARLSQGWLKNDCVVCPFHGLEFDSSGKCTHVPELGRDAPGMKIETHLLHEAHGFLWWKRGSVEASVPPWFDELPGGSWGTHDAHQWNQHVSRCIENQLDYAHLPFVHADTIGRGSDPKRSVKFVSSPDEIRMVMDFEARDAEITEHTGIRFLYPCLWRLKILPKFSVFIAFVAVDSATTRMYLRAYQAWVQLPILRDLVGWVMRRFNRKVLRQDLDVVLGQSPKDVRHLNADCKEALLPSDEAIRSFRKWLGGQS